MVCQAWLCVTWDAGQLQPLPSVRGVGPAYLSLCSWKTAPTWEPTLSVVLRAPPHPQAGLPLGAPAHFHQHPPALPRGAPHLLTAAHPVNVSDSISPVSTSSLPNSSKCSNLMPSIVSDPCCFIAVTSLPPGWRVWPPLLHVEGGRSPRRPHCHRVTVPLCSVSTLGAHGFPHRCESSSFRPSYTFSFFYLRAMLHTFLF